MKFRWLYQKTLNSGLNQIESLFGFWLKLVGFPGGSDSKESACNVQDPSSILELGRSPRVGNGNPLWHSYLENPMDRVAWWAIVLGVTKSQT